MLKIWTHSLPILFCLMGPAFGEEQDCRKTAMTQLDMNRCEEAYLKKAQAELDSVYRQLMQKTSSENRHKLKEARDAWQIYKNKQCEFDTYGTITGSINPMVWALCHAGQTEAYTKVLRYQLDCEEGDLSCVGR